MPNIKFGVKRSTMKMFRKTNKLLGFSSMRDFFNNAISVFRWCTKEVAEGRRIGSFEPDGEGGIKSLKELTTPAFDRIASLEPEKAKALFIER